MRLSDILRTDCIKVPLASTEKQAALFELVELMGEVGAVTEVQQLKDAVWSRELQRTTGMGLGVGVPHGRTDCLDELHMAIGLPAEPIEFGAIDNKPVEIVILLASPTDHHTEHIQALAKISQMLTNDSFREAIKRAASPKALYDMLIQHEAELAGA